MKLALNSDIVLPPELDEASEKLAVDLAACGGLFDRFPVAAYADSITTCRRGYKFIPAESREWSRAIEREFGRDTLERYHQMLLLELMQRFRGIADDSSYRYHDSVLPQFRMFFDGILQRIDEPLQGLFVFGKSGFDKDLGVCSQNLIPCGGAQFVDRAAGVPRSILLKVGWGQGWSLGSFMARRVGGFKPLFEMHMDVRSLSKEFSLAGFTACYRRIAEMMKLDRRIKGVFGSCWWFDSQLAEIAPRLSFLRDLPAQGGAGIFFTGVDEANTRDALRNSPQRRLLYEKGTYRPRRFLMVWGRDDLLAWAARCGDVER
jgi:hypothetical protein